MALVLLCPNLGWIQGQFNFTELSLRYLGRSTECRNSRRRRSSSDWSEIERRRKLRIRKFACEPDAQIATEKWFQEHPQFCFRSLESPLITRKEEEKTGPAESNSALWKEYEAYCV
ncbi:hypothetical protein DSECCO2_19100 [anaerobic digester metagenome]